MVHLFPLQGAFAHILSILVLPLCAKESYPVRDAPLTRTATDRGSPARAVLNPTALLLEAVRILTWTVSRPSAIKRQLECMWLVDQATPKRSYESLYGTADMAGESDAKAARCASWALVERVPKRAPQRRRFLPLSHRYRDFVGTDRCRRDPGGEASL
jgi:hypothetical protein